MEYSIGEFSKMTALSVKSLRLYHDKGILVPSRVDQFSGYRFYDDSSYQTAMAIQVLKSYEFSLAEIKEVLAACDEEKDLLNFLKSKLSEIQTKIGQYQEISQSIEAIMQSEGNVKMLKHQGFEIEEKELDTILIAGYRMQEKYSEVGKGFRRLAKKIGRYINGKPMSLYYDLEYKEDEADLEACYPVRKGKEAEGISIRELKGGQAVTLIHKGPYSTIGASYRQLFHYLHEKGHKTLLPIREVYLKGPGMIFKGKPKNYLTEIQVLLKG